MKRVLYIQYTNPAAYPPLEHSSRILARNDWQILFLGVKVLGVNALSFPAYSHISVRLLHAYTQGWQQKLHYLWFCLWVICWTIRWQPRWVYASDFLACPIALFLSILPGIKVIYHEHDSPSLGDHSNFVHFCLKTRKWLAQRAEICILPNHSRTEQFIQENQPTGPVFCVWNCPALEEISQPQFRNNNQEIWLLYHGSVVPSRLPTSVLSALAHLPVAVKLQVIGYETMGSQGYVQQLQDLALQLGVSDRVNFLAAMSRSELLKYCHRCDIGLALTPANSNDINMQYMVGASNKAFDYLACGLAVLVSDLPDWRQTYVQPGYGLSCNPGDPQSIVSAIQKFLESPEQMRQMGERGHQRIATEWNYERQFSPVLERMNELNQKSFPNLWIFMTAKLLPLLPPQLPGKSRLARFLLGSSLRAQNVKIRDRYGCTIILPTLKESVGFHLFIDHVYEIDTAHLILNHLKTGSVFVDIGANIGTFTLSAAQKVGSQGCVIAIEPSPTIFPYLKENILLNDLLNVHSVQCAAFDKEVEIPFYEAPIENFGMGSIAAQFHGNPITVSAQTLDNILRRENVQKADLLKVDVEGFEVAVFRGAEQLLTSQNPPLIVFEFCDWAESRFPEAKVGDAQNLLRDWGYKLWRIKDFLNNQPALTDVITQGSEILVARK